MTTQTYHGSCHCGAVTFTVDLDLAQATRCNCSICTKLGWLGALTKPAAFQRLTGEPTAYPWRTQASRRHFCPTCGTQCYGTGNVPELGGEFVSINVRCLDGVEVDALPVIYWDGRHDNWQAGPRTTPWPIAA